MLSVPNCIMRYGAAGGKLHPRLSGLFPLRTECSTSSFPREGGRQTCQGKTRRTPPKSRQKFSLIHQTRKSRLSNISSCFVKGVHLHGQGNHNRSIHHDHGSTIRLRQPPSHCPFRDSIRMVLQVRVSAVGYREPRSFLPLVRPQSSRPDDTIRPSTSPTMASSIQFLLVLATRNWTLREEKSARWHMTYENQMKPPSIAPHVARTLKP